MCICLCFKTSCVLSSLSFTIVLCAIFRSFSQNCESRSSKRSLSISILSTWYSILEPWFSIVSSIANQVSNLTFEWYCRWLVQMWKSNLMLLQPSLCLLVTWITSTSGGRWRLLIHKHYCQVTLTLYQGNE